MRLMGVICFILCSAQLNASFIETSAFGIRADEIKIDVTSIPEPTLSRSGKSFVTDNKFGFDVLQVESNWVIETFLKDIKPGMTILDVGSGYGALTRQALDRNAVVISNDISKEMLFYNLKHLSQEKKSRLYLNNLDLKELSFPENTVDLIIFHRVLHFFKGAEIEEVLIKSFKWLKPNGKIYIVMMSKDHICFRDKIFYDTSKKWPGENLVIPEKHLPEQAYGLPKTLHVMSIETLQPILEKIGFQIEKTGFVGLQKVGVEPNRDGKEAIGIIAVKGPLH